MRNSEAVAGVNQEKSTARTEAPAASPIARGWFWPENSRKAHYFVGQRSLCAKMALFYSESRELSDANHYSKDNCAKCRDERTKRYGMQTAISELRSLAEKIDVVRCNSCGALLYSSGSGPCPKCGTEEPR